ncbi:adipokinetic hormone domain-containing protein [Phthorimaea operculella]|nr:adipokinetic hormone domain-containing protein [Phthorimaea operculella]
MYKLLALFLVVCVVLSEAQLTFTSSWGGKRSGSIVGTLNCRNEETIATIYKLIQNEAEKLLLCQKSS